MYLLYCFLYTLVTCNFFLQDAHKELTVVNKMTKDRPEDLHKSITLMKNYCDLWKLNINVSKTKITIFSRGKTRKIPKFQFGETQLEVTDLGLIFNFNGKFTKAKKLLYDKGARAMFALLRRGRHLQLPVDIMIHLFDTLVKPVLLYGSEIWTHEGTEILEKPYLRFCKYILLVNKTTCLNMVYGELGEYPLILSAQTRMIMSWANISQDTEKTTLSNLMYKLLYKLNRESVYKSPWLNCVKTILEDCGFPGIWESQVIPCSKECFKQQIKQRLLDQFRQKWAAEIQQSSKCLNYRIFKSNLKIDSYLTTLTYNNRRLLARFRCRNHNLPVETWCHRGIPREQRKCNWCVSELGNEFHFILNCSNSNTLRSQLIKIHHTIRPSAFTFDKLMNTSNMLELKKLLHIYQYCTKIN